MSLWLDGVYALSNHIWAVFIILALCFWGIFVIRALLQRMVKPLTEIELLTLGATGWVFPVLLLSILTFIISLFTNIVIGRVFLVLIISFSSFFIFREKINLVTVLCFALFLSIFIVLRFAFLKDLFLPSYFDSAEHYHLISLIIDSYRIGEISNGLKDVFYHVGFHFISALCSVFLHVDAIDFMLSFGQIMLAFLSFSLFFVVKRETGSSLSAIFACLICTFGFHMPAYSMNWGKYPALLGLMAMLFVFGLAYIFYRKDKFRVYRMFFVLLVAVALISVFIHSRTLIVFGSILIAFFITSWWNRLNSVCRLAGFCIAIFFLGILLSFVGNSVVLNPLIKSYFHDDFWMLLLILGLTFASTLHYTKQSFFLIMWLVIIMLCLFIPVSLPTIGLQTLLDRPFVQMFVVVPLSALGGLGIASLMELFRHLNTSQPIFRFFIPFVLFTLVISNVAINYRFYTSSCCRFVTLDDIAAFSWLEESLVSNKRILVASSNLYINVVESSQPPVGVDAGIWLSPLLSQETAFADHNISFDIKSTYAELCVYGVDYIYVGGMPESFNSSELDMHPNWYFSAFVLPSAKIYQVIGCEP